MFIWIGCKLPGDFEEKLRARCLSRNESIGLDTVAFSLPQHISLKISFEAERHEAVLEDLAAYLTRQAPFAVRIQNPEQAGNILWLPIGEHAQLQRLHRELDARLESKFGVPQHPFDKTFLFHSTLFIDQDASKISAMREALSEDFTEQELPIDTFLLGLSETGKNGSYQVVRTIKLKEM